VFFSRLISPTERAKVLLLPNLGIGKKETKEAAPVDLVGGRIQHVQIEWQRVQRGAPRRPRRCPGPTRRPLQRTDEEELQLLL
jgi:hypothetical protein